MAVGKSVAVIGGGWAGLAAAIEAKRRGHAVTLFEMAPQLGGRARSVAAGGNVFDNGQHILIGAYRATLGLMRTVGVDVERAFDRRPLTLVDPNGVGLKLPPGPATIAFMRAVWRHPTWTRGDKLGLLAAAASWMLRGFRCAPAITVADLTRQLPGAVQCDLIEPLCVAALNTPAHEASGTVFLRVLKDALFSGAGSADLMLPRLGLSELLPDPAERWLRRAGAELRIGRRVEAIERKGNGWRIDAEPFDAVIVACTAVEAARLVRPLRPDWADAASALRYEPIVTCYLASDATLREPMLALACADDKPAQFVFDRGQLGGASGVLAFVISGAASWVERGAAATLDAVLAQARQTLGARTQLSELRSYTEKRATFRCTPGLDRPPMTIEHGLLAAADYVRGPYPATLEGAVLSGLSAAAAL